MKKNNKGFTLAEMLIVVAIVGVLVSIVTAAVTNSLEKSRETADLANIRNGYAELVSVAELDGEMKSYISEGSGSNGKYYTLYVKAKQKKSGWQSTNFTIIDSKYILIEGCKIETPSDDKKVYKLTYYVDEMTADALHPNDYHFVAELIATPSNVVYYTE